MRWPRWMTGITCAGIVAWGAIAPAHADETQPSETRTTMRGIYVALSNAYIYSLSDTSFADPANREAIRGALLALARNTEQLGVHGGGLDDSFDYLRRSLSRDAHEAAASFQRGEYIRSRFIISKITENCVTCHTKLPAKQKFDFGEEFLHGASLDDIPPQARFNILVATRQFDAALETDELFFLAPSTTPNEIRLTSPFEGYLKVAIGALNDPERAADNLQSFAAREDMPQDLTKNVNAWVASLRKLDLDADKGKELSVARGLIGPAESKSAADRSHLVDWVAGTALLHRYLQTRPENVDDVAEAFYLLGVADSRISRSYWVSETDFLLEKAAGPGGAARAEGGSRRAARACKQVEKFSRL